jgi:hypothetical protein
METALAVVALAEEGKTTSFRRCFPDSTNSGHKACLGASNPLKSSLRILVTLENFSRPVSAATPLKVSVGDHTHVLRKLLFKVQNLSARTKDVAHQTVHPFCFILNYPAKDNFSQQRNT